MAHLQKKKKYHLLPCRPQTFANCLGKAWYGLSEDSIKGPQTRTLWLQLKGHESQHAAPSCFSFPPKQPPSISQNSEPRATENQANNRILRNEG